MADVTSAAYWLNQANLWAAALENVQAGKQWTIGNRQLASADSAEIRSNIDTCWRNYVALTAEAAGIKGPGYRTAKWS